MAKTPEDRLAEYESSETAILTGAQEGSVDNSHSFKHPLLSEVDEGISKAEKDIILDATAQGIVGNNINFAAIEDE